MRGPESCLQQIIGWQWWCFTNRTLLMRQRFYWNKVTLIEPCQQTLPTNRLINIIKAIQAERDLGDNTYKILYPTVMEPQSSMGYPKFTKSTTQDHSFQWGHSYIWSNQGSSLHSQTTGRPVFPSFKEHTKL